MELSALPRRLKTATDYATALQEALPRNHPLHDVLTSHSNKTQRVYYTGTCEINSGGIDGLQNVIEQAQTDLASRHQAVCVVENIHPDWINGLGSAWDIPSKFFVDHATNSEGSGLWDTVMNQGRFRLFHSNASDAYQHFTVEGILPHLADPKRQTNHSRHPRRYEWDAYYGWQSSMKISYCLSRSKSLCKSTTRMY